MSVMEIKVIGVGGIGCALLPHLCRYLNYGSPPPGDGDGPGGAPGPRARVTLVDGDDFEARNAARQAFGAAGNKARVKAAELAREFEALSLRAVPEYVHEGNAAALLGEGDVVFLAVDNHRTRNVVSDHCRTLRSAVLISGGNDLTDGNVQVYVRREGRDVTLPLTQFHPEIAEPRDRSPAEMSCDELARAGAPQLLFANLAVASAMLNAFYAWQQEALAYGEVYLDILQARANPVPRVPAPGPAPGEAERP
jgi:molybdopterin/thiamine biosynthesis adenylyltransferase